jgi:hypothetical protein
MFSEIFQGANIFALIAMVLFGAFVYLAAKKVPKGEKIIGIPKVVFVVICLVPIVISLWQIVGYFGIIPGISPLTVAGTVKAQAVAPPVPSNPAANVPSTPSTPTPTPSTPTSSSRRAMTIDTLAVSQVKEKYSNAYNVIDGTLNIYDSGTNPSDATANTIDTITIADGQGSSTNKLILTETPYRVVFTNGSATGYYDVDYGIVTFTSANFNPNTGQYSFVMTGAGTPAPDGIAKIATIDDMMNETAISGIINGQTACAGTEEINCTSAVDELVYDESAGDGQFYVDPTFSFSGANTEIKQPVLCFEWDVSNPPEGNEYSAFTAQLRTGNDLGIPSDLIDYWANEQCVSLGNAVAGSTSSTYRLTISITEANADTTDDWYLYVDDLGGIRARDVLASNKGATYDRTLFDVEA